MVEGGEGGEQKSTIVLPKTITVAGRPSGEKRSNLLSNTLRTQTYFPLSLGSAENNQVTAENAFTG